jgi:hypothetical protein
MEYYPVNYRLSRSIRNLRNSPHMNDSLMNNSSKDTIKRIEQLVNLKELQLE